MIEATKDIRNVSFGGEISLHGGFDGANCTVNDTTACLGSRSAGSTATPTAATATRHPAAAATTGRANRALSRCSVGTGSDRIDLSARSDHGGTLVGEEFEP